MKTISNGQNTLLPLTNGRSPWLVFPSGEHREKQEFFNVSDSQDIKSYRKSICGIRGKQCLASMHGWLVLKSLERKKGLRNKVNCCIWNHETEEKISLPVKDSQDIDLFNTCYLSSPPTHPDCMVLFVSKQHLYFCQLREKKWRKQSCKIVKGDMALDDYIDHVITSSPGTIYALTLQKQTAIIEREPSGALSVRLLEFEEPNLYPETSCSVSYAVESFGEVYYIVIHYLDINTEAINHVEIFKMNLSQKKWVKVKSIGDTVFFLSVYGCLSLRASSSGMEGDTIYFTTHRDNTLYVYGVKGASLSLYLPCRKLDSSFFSPFWLWPSDRIAETYRENINTTTSEELKMEDINIEHVAIKETVMDCEVSGWADLPRDVLWSMTTHILFGKDYTNIRQVCKTWNRSLPPIRWGSNSTIQYPWLMFSNRETSKYNLLDPVLNMRHTVDMPELSSSKICSSKDGWVLMSRDDQTMFFFNPFNSVRINLPDLPARFLSCRMSFSSLPTSPDCMVFGVSSLTYTLVNICYLNIRDGAWTLVECQENDVQFLLSPSNPVFYNGAFYCLSYEMHLGVFKLKNDRWVWPSLPTPEPHTSRDLNYLSECNGNLLSICVGRNGKCVHVHKLDCLEQTWMLVDDLEDQMVFVSRRTFMALQGIDERTKNKIYFPLSYKDVNNCVFYCLNAIRWCSSSEDYSSEDIYDATEQMHCTWIQPTLSWK